MRYKTVGLNRILKLAAFVEKKPRHRFDFAVIVGEGWKYDPTLSCGTTACGLGWATAMPLFHKLGLHIGKETRQVELDENNDWKYIGKQIFGGLTLPIMYSLFQPNDFMDDGEYYDYDSDTQFPSLNDEATPKQWARHARRVVKMLQKINERKSE